MGTPRLPKGKVGRAIVAYLRKEAPRAVRVWEIVAETGFSKATVRKEVHRLAARDPPPVLRVDHGWYRAWMDPGDLAKLERPLPCLHAIQLAVEVPRNAGMPPPVPQARVTGAGPIWQPESHQFHDVRVWRGRKVFLQWSASTGTILVSVGASESPLKPFEFREMLEWLSGVFEGIGWVWDERLVKVENVEFNLDYRTLSLTEFRKVRLKGFTNAWVQAYQKAERLMRVELRISPKPELSAKELVALLEALQRVPEMPPAEPGGGYEDPGPMFG